MWLIPSLLLGLCFAQTEVEKCQVLIYSDDSKNPSKLNDVTGLCPDPSIFRALILDLGPTASSSPSLKEVAPTTRQSYVCPSSQEECFLVVTGYGLSEGDRVNIYSSLGDGNECPGDEIVGTMTAEVELKTLSGYVLPLEDRPLSDSTTLTVFKLPSTLMKNQSFFLCYAPSYASPDNVFKTGHFRYLFATLQTSGSLLNCSFEKDMCGFFGFKNKIFEDLVWSHVSGSTETPGTGPSHDNTLGPEKKNGKYMLMDSPGYLAGAPATLLSPIYMLEAGEYCLEFAFHMYGDDVNSLRVYVHNFEKNHVVESDKKYIWGDPSWVKIGDHGDKWIKSALNFKSDAIHPTQFVFEAVAGFSEKGDIALDDVTLFAGSCPSDLIYQNISSTHVCGEVRLKSGNWSADKTWFVEGSVSCSGRGYSYDQLEGNWFPCCVPSYGEYQLILGDKYADGWDGSILEFRFFDSLSVYGDDFSPLDGHQKRYSLKVGQVRIAEAKGSEDKIELVVDVYIPQAYLYCGVSRAGAEVPTGSVLRRYGVRLSELTGVHGEMGVTLVIQNQPGERKTLQPNTEYDVFCYAETSIQDSKYVMDENQINLTRTTVTTDATPPNLMVKLKQNTQYSVIISLTADEPSYAHCLPSYGERNGEKPFLSEVKLKGVSVKIDDRRDMELTDLYPDVDYKIYCYGEDMTKPVGNFSLSNDVIDVKTVSKIPDIKIESYQTFSQGFKLIVRSDTPCVLYCGAAVAGSSEPTTEKLEQAGSTGQIDDPSKSIKVEIRGVPRNTRYTAYCFATSKGGTSRMSEQDMLNTALEISSFGEFCKLPTEPRTVSKGPPTPFDPLTSTEEFKAKNFLLKSLNIAGTYRINLFLDKTKVLDYLHKGKDFPLRYARVRVGVCERGVGKYKQYKVGPLNPDMSMTYEQLGDSIDTDCGGYSPQGVFGRRLDYEEKLSNVDVKLSNFLEQSFGYPYNIDDCYNSEIECLQLGSIIYDADTPTDTKIIELDNNLLKPNPTLAYIGLKTPYHKPLPFYFVVHPPHVDIDNPANNDNVKQKLDLMNQPLKHYWYNNKTFDSLEDLIHAFENNIDNIKLTPSDLKSPVERRLGPGPSAGGRGGLEYRLGPEHIEPQGKRFTVKSSPDSECYTVDYNGWSFVMNNDRDTGLRIWNLMFNDNRIAFEVGLMEALAHYSVAERNFFFLDSWYGGLGSAARKIHPGIECPKTGQLLFWDDSLCIFELDLGRPLRSHWQNGELRDGAPHFALIVRQILTVSNYDYITDYTFQPSGVFEGSISFTGELYAGVEIPWYSSRQGKYGTQVTSSMRMGALHNHFAVWKIDFDIKSTQNSILIKEIIPDPRRPGAHQVHSHIAESEKHAFFKYNTTRPLHYFVVNEDHQVYGNTGGFYVNPRPTIQILQEDFELYSGPAAWSKYRIFSHVRKDWELDCTLPRDNKYASRPAVDVDRYIEDDEVIRRRDIVTWVTSGIWHLPHVEDMPLTVSIGNTLGWMVKPANFFLEDPSMDLHNARGGDVKDPGACAVIRDGNNPFSA